LTNPAQEIIMCAMKKGFLLLPLLFVFAPQKVYSRNINSVMPNTSSLQQMRDNTEAVREVQKEVQENVQDRVRERTQEICDQLGKRITKRVDLFESNKTHHIERYDLLKSKLQEVVTKLKAKGFDTGELESNLLELDRLIKTYVQEYTKFIDILKGALASTCGESQGTFKEGLQNARAQLREARTARRAIWEFYKNTIREDIKNLRQQAEQMQTTETTNE